MKFEKLNENKIRITLTIQDLAEKEIDFHVFMSNSAEAQDILLDMLEQAKKETGFDPEDYNLKVEALVMADTNFIFTITKLPPEEKSKISKRKFTVKRKNIVPSSTQAVYCFGSFDDFNDFLVFLSLIFIISTQYVIPTIATLIPSNSPIYSALKLVAVGIKISLTKLIA